MSDRMYNTLRALAEVILPSIATLYFALASIWGLPYGEQIVGTITAIDCFIGAVVAYNRKEWKEGDSE